MGNSYRTFDEETGQELNFGLNDAQLDRRLSDICAVRGCKYGEALNILHREYFNGEMEKEHDAAVFAKQQRERKERAAQDARRAADPAERLEGVAHDILKSGRNSFIKSDFSKIYGLLADAHTLKGMSIEEIADIARTKKYCFKAIVQELK